MWTGRFWVFFRCQNWFALCFFTIVPVSWQSELNTRWNIYHLSFWNETQSDIWKFTSKWYFSPPVTMQGLNYSWFMYEGKNKVYVTRSVERCYNCSWSIRAHDTLIILTELLQRMMYSCDAFPFMFIFSTNLCWAEHENLFNVTGCLHSH